MPDKPRLTGITKIVRKVYLQFVTHAQLQVQVYSVTSPILIQNPTNFYLVLRENQQYLTTWQIDSDAKH